MKSQLSLLDVTVLKESSLGQDNLCWQPEESPEKKIYFGV